MTVLHRYVFIFRDPLDRTSLPLAELVAVLRRLHGPLSISYGHVNDLEQIAPLKAPDFGCAEALIIALAQSAVVLATVPLRVPEIVARSGYVHSGGSLVYCEAWPKADTVKVTSACTEYLKNTDTPAAKLVWYTKAYAEGHKRGDGSKANVHPLEALEIDQRRFHLGERPFKEESQRVVQDLPRGGKQALLYAYRDVTDDGAPQSSYLRYRGRSSQDWLIIYETLGKKENPIHDLDDLEERKLFWAGIFTTPHRLINAMLNLCEVGEGSVVVDPFAHTGTVAIEAAQLGATTRSFDLSEVRGAQDNFEFFCSPNPGTDLSEIEESLKDEDLTRSLTDLALEHSEVNNLGLPDIQAKDRIETLMSGPLGSVLATRRNRLLYWLVRRSILEAKRNHSNKFDSHAFATTLVADLRPHLRRLDNLSGPPLHAEPLPAGSLCSVPGARVSSEVFFDDFEDQSPRAFLSYRVMDMKSHTFALNDITKGLSDVGDASVDAVVTDPPYGYGDEIEYSQLREIWVSFIRESLRVLRDGGMLAFCALDKVKTGRPEKQLLTTDEIVQLLNSAAAQGRRYFSFPSIDPVASQSHGLFYWKSKSALNRSIVAVRVFRATPSAH